MIKKFQQGGPQQGGVLAQILLLPKELLAQIMLAFAQWAQQKGVDIKLLQLNPQALEQALGLFILEMQQSARYGAKLNYIKSLKHQCAEDEEVYYYKRGGSVGCGCKKKLQDGGPVKKKTTTNNGVNKFRQDQNKKINTPQQQWTSLDDKHLYNARKKQGKNLTPEESSAIKKWNNLSSEQKNKYQMEEGKCGMKVKKALNGTNLGDGSGGRAIPTVNYPTMLEASVAPFLRTVGKVARPLTKAIGRYYLSLLRLPLPSSGYTEAWTNAFSRSGGNRELADQVANSYLLHAKDSEFLRNVGNQAFRTASFIGGATVPVIAGFAKRGGTR